MATPRSAAILSRMLSIHLWRISSMAPPSGRDFTAMLRTSSRYVLRPSFLLPVSLRFMARSASMTTNPLSMA